MFRYESLFFIEVVFIVGCIFFNLPKVESKCAGIASPFDILPKGDHKIEFGTSLDLYCKLNKSYEGAELFHAKDLNFYVLNKKSKYIFYNTTIVNETTLQLHLVEPPLGSTYYYCSLNNTKDCLTNVQVGYKPKPVLNFQCKSINWERLVCTWTPPENPIKTIYRLNYSLTGRAGRTPRPCPGDLDLLNNTCIYDFETDPQYRQPYEYFSFEMFGQNALGNSSNTYKFHHFAHVIPNKPENVTVLNKTEGSAVIGWNIPFPLIHFPPGLSFKIEYKNKWEDWVDVKISKSERIYGKNYTYNITGLKYSHTPYDVRIYLKSFVASIGSNDWSSPASVIFLTPSSIPSMAPTTTQGCYDIVSNGNDTDVFVYWTRIPEKFENGDKFGYNVICIKDNKKDCGLPLEKSMTFAKFQISSLHSYSFTIYSVNEVGRSEDNSFVFISKYDSLIQPESFTKVAYDQGVFELSWKPVAHENLSNYTIFWCKEDKDLPMPCRGYIDWVTVSKETTSKNITMSDVTKFYKFAISANLNDGSSSGMVWSSCVIFHDKVLKKVDDFHISRVGSREVEVVWEIRCAQSSAFKGFAFYYCPVGVSLQDNSCAENTTETVTKLNGSLERKITLTNLRPYTTYKLQISIISLDGSQQIQLGPRSLTKRFDTLQDAPSIPYNVTVVSVTNASAILKWAPPKETNGVLQNYKLYREYLGFKNKLEFEARDNKNNIVDEYEVKDLISFTKYSFTLKACTSIKCSEMSEPVVFKTLMGIPGKMLKPQVSLISPTMADIAWSTPEPSAGFLDYYQLSIANNEIFNVTGLRGKVEFHSCEVKYKTEFRMRAINIDRSKNTTYFGPWSDPTEVNCGLSVWAENNVLINWISGSSTVIIVSACLFYIIKKGWLQCRKMKDVEVKLPPGLQSQDLEKDTQDYVHLERWPPRSPEPITGSGGTALAPDEESLLDKKSDESMDITSFKITAKNGGDSSGCSVGRESVSSSITSDTHISSDSGAEPDQCIITSTPFELWNSGRNPSNMKNRSPKEILNFSRELGGWDLSESAIPGYTKVGFTNCFVPEKNLPGKGYVTIASVSSINPQLMTNTNNNNNNNYSLDDDSLEKNDSENNNQNTFPSDAEPKNVNLNSQPNSAGPKYVSLAHFEGQKAKDSSLPGSHINRSVTTESPQLSGLDESTEPQGERTRDFSGNETETEKIHEVPLKNDFSAMPPYVSISETPCIIPTAEKKGEENKTEENTVNNDEVVINEEANKRLALDTNELNVNKTVNGIDSAVVDGKVTKENDSFSNYIPHHMFGRESMPNS